MRETIAGTQANTISVKFLHCVTFCWKLCKCLLHLLAIWLIGFIVITSLQNGNDKVTTNIMWFRGRLQCFRKINPYKFSVNKWISINIDRCQGFFEYPRTTTIHYLKDTLVEGLYCFICNWFPNNVGLNELTTASTFRSFNLLVFPINLMIVFQPKILASRRVNYYWISNIIAWVVYWLL